MRLNPILSMGVALVLVLPAFVTGGPEDALPVSAVYVRTAPGTALELAPECDRALTVRTDGIDYALALLHRRWRLAVVTLRVSQGPKTYLLRAAFTPEGILADLATDPPLRLDQGLYDACLGLNARDIRPQAGRPGEPLGVLQTAARDFLRVRDAGTLAAALALAQTRVDTVSGATP